MTDEECKLGKAIQDLASRLSNQEDFVRIRTESLATVPPELPD